MNIEQLREKSIAILGLGVNNKKLADFLSRQNISYQVIKDWKTPEELTDKITDFDIIFRTPGLPYLASVIQDAKSRGVEIYSQTKLFFDLCQATIIGVTGTKGKGTTSSLIASILKSAGKRHWLGGNIGRDPFEFIEQVKLDDFVVLELSSFQLQDLHKSPHIAVVLSITPDHLNHHKNFDEYIQAKSNILVNQTEADFAVLHPMLPDWFKKLGKAEKILINPEDAREFPTKLLGKHNLDNIAAACAVASVLKIDKAAVASAVREFKPLPHRLNILKTVEGITYVDDGFSTNIEPTIAAINAIKGNLILILGGFDKGLDFKTVAAKIKEAGNVKGVVVIGQVTDKILSELRGFKGKILTGAKDMSEIVSQAKSLAKAGDTVLFSPGTSSFDMFKNETDRANQFISAVESL